ncbi:uncharacterized protein PGTG_14984 [Puccinia graminis f. sp. tritici CRL 75-36-700-3]|uniref:GCM domain-containing protein n=1 Tax=Puccinia graminis f. sp. tritici (strain CRL 75-36-700-3 / race SCCL) TaxID=418459 RepID=E3KXT1_PUCGT|nr:uncharacterized protein PGTG_14984 [Puccinia graminis f. sp. tritici CRL 75-36-700-3]EFP89143.2 hypothetical protein PGTG_14984 [Puccinia graminis f. sp. tritici CRL 75-36-700-3]
MYNQEDQSEYSSNYDEPDWESDEEDSDANGDHIPEETGVPTGRLANWVSNEEDSDEDKGDEIDDVTGKKVFFLPTGNEVTFIDHDCTLDSEGYPLLPNGKTIFVKPPGVEITNWGEVGYTKKVGTEFRSKGLWKLRRVNCLGVIRCDQPGCRWAGSPPTGQICMKTWLEKHPKCRGLNGKCPGQARHVPCKNTIARFDTNTETGWSILRHYGTHKHPWPEAKKPDKLAKKKLKAEIAKNPKEGAFSLKIGKPSAPKDPFDSVLKIHPSLAHADQLRYHRRQMLTDLGIVPGKKGANIDDKFLIDMFQWNKCGLRIISAGFQEDAEHFTFQTEWMAKRLVARDIDHKVYSQGLVSDVTYRFFLNGYLLSTSMFCEELSRWIPVQLTWIRGLSENYYKIHFATLFRQFLKPDITKEERDVLVCNVVDFSAAQREGFVEAYWEVFGICDKKIVLGKLQGCHEHFWAQVTRVKKNRHIVMPDEENLFQSMFLALIKEPKKDDPTHEEKIDELRRRFPKARKWFDWWTMADVEAMLFPTRRAQEEDGPERSGQPTLTTNAQESLHWLYYMFRL